jgi:hypothetical protein
VYNILEAFFSTTRQRTVLLLHGYCETNTCTGVKLSVLKHTIQQSVRYTEHHIPLSRRCDIRYCRGRDIQDSRERNIPDSRGRDMPDIRYFNLQDSRGRDIRDSRVGDTVVI